MSSAHGSFLQRLVRGTGDGQRPVAALGLRDDHSPTRPVSGPQHAAACHHADPAGRDFGAEHVDIPALAQRYGQGFWHLLCRHATFIVGLSGGHGTAADRDRPDIGPLWPPPGDPVVDGDFHLCHGRRDARPDCRNIPGFPHVTRHGCIGHGPQPRDRARHGPARRSGVDDRLCHDGHGVGADGRADDRRRAGPDVRLAGVIRVAGGLRRRGRTSGLCRSGRNDPGARPELCRAIQVLPGIADLGAVLGLCFMCCICVGLLLCVSGRCVVCGGSGVRPVTALDRNSLGCACGRLCLWQLPVGPVFGAGRDQPDDPVRVNHPDCRNGRVPAAGAVRADQCDAVLWVLHLCRNR